MKATKRVLRRVIGRIPKRVGTTCLVSRGGWWHALARIPKRIPKRILPLGVMLLAALVSPGEGDPTPDELHRLFEQGNRLYQADDHRGAADAYQTILDRGYEASDVYYNLGNASLELGDLGPAVWAYARARALDPFDPDITANLARARSLRVDAAPADDDDGALSRILAGVDGIPVRLAWRGVEVLYWGTAAVILALLLRPAWRRPLVPVAWGLGLLLVVGLAYTGARTAVERGQTSAVVRPAELPVRSEPDEAGKLVFTLHAGSEVRVERRVGGWVEISLGPELRGWVPDPEILVI
jgi:hypothetical protein